MIQSLTKTFQKAVKNQDYRELGQKGLQAFLIRIIGFVSGYFFIYLIVRRFGAATNGLVALSLSVMVIGSLICRLGTDINFTKIFAIQGNLRNASGLYLRVLPRLFFLSSSAATLIYVLSPWLSYQVFKEPDLIPFLRWTTPAIVFFTITLLNAAVLRGLKKNSAYSFFFNGGRFLFALLFLILFLLIGKQELNLFAIRAHTVSTGILALSSCFIVYKEIRPLKWETDYKLGAYFKDSFPMMISSSVIILLAWADTVILGMFESSNVVGVYNVVLKLALVTSFSFQAIDSILAPKLSSVYHDGEMKRFEDMVQLSTTVNLIISLGVVLVLVLTRNWVLSIFGPEFHMGSLALIILCCGQLANAICGPVGSVFQMTGNQVIFQRILVWALVLNIGLNLALVKPLGIEGVAIATAVSLLFWNIISVILIRKRLGITMFNPAKLMVWRK